VSSVVGGDALFDLGSAAGAELRIGLTPGPHSSQNLGSSRLSRFGVVAIGIIMLVFRRRLLSTASSIRVIPAQTA
jgi:hypothetical protein